MEIQALKGACMASSVYADGVQVGVNIGVSLPEVAMTETEVNAAGGVIALPVWTKLEAMECSITKQGVDPEWLRCMKPEPFDLTVNIVQQSMQTDGTQKAEHIKAHLRVVSKGIPQIEASYGESMEQEVKLSVISYKLIVDGAEYLHVSPKDGIFSVNGKDYSDGIKSML